MTDISNSGRAIIPSFVGSPNRGNDTVSTTSNIAVTLESINEILMDHLRNVIIPTIDDNGHVRAVPILYASSERWATIRKDGFIRDPTNDKLLTPLIAVKRNGVRQGQLINPNNKYMYRTQSGQWNARNAYDRFAVQNNIRPSQKVTHTMVPDYVDLPYTILMWTEYQSQMDTLIEQINVENNEYWGQRNNYKFRVAIDEFTREVELPAAEDRFVRSSFDIL